MRLLPRSTPILLTLLLLGGCSTAIQLTDAGRGVQHVSRADMPTGCNLLGDIAIGIPPDAARPRTEEELHILMRNKTGELGGNHFVLDSMQEEQDASGAAYFRGRGIGYACPVAPEAEGETSGGDSGDEDSSHVDESPSEDSGEEPGLDAEDDAMLNDILGE
ncbi:MAG TPA: hypothetical protein ENK57_02070 [Polyangiaceae bacterium]|nr:hypothetical protein [Polyangiaceae bacterium]